MTMLWLKHYVLSVHYDTAAAALYRLVPLDIHSTRRPSGRRREDPLCSYKVCVLDGVGPVQKSSVLQTFLQYMWYKDNSGHSLGFKYICRVRAVSRLCPLAVGTMAADVELNQSTPDSVSRQHVNTLTGIGSSSEVGYKYCTCCLEKLNAKYFLTQLYFISCPPFCVHRL